MHCRANRKRHVIHTASGRANSQNLRYSPGKFMIAPSTVCRATPVFLGGAQVYALSIIFTALQTAYCTLLARKLCPNFATSIMLPAVFMFSIQTIHDAKLSYSVLFVRINSLPHVIKIMLIQSGKYYQEITIEFGDLKANSRHPGSEKSIKIK